MSTRYLGVSQDIGGTIITNSGSPSGATDLANKGYVDNLVAGLEWKQSVRVASTANLAVASAVINGATVDGISLVTGDRILLKNQTTQTENGIYIVAASGAASRATDADTTAELNNATVSVIVGTAGGGKSYTQTTANPTIGSSNIVWAQFNVGNVYTASTGLTLSTLDFQLASSSAGAGITFAAGVHNVVATDTSITVNADDLQVHVASGSGVTGPGLTVSSGLKVDSSVARVFRQATNANTTSIAVTHGLGTAAVLSSVSVTSTGEVVECDTVNTSTTVTTFTFGTAPTLNTLTFVIVG